MDPILISPAAVIGLPVGVAIGLILAAIKLGRMFEAHRRRLVDLEVEVGLAPDKKHPPDPSLLKRVGEIEDHHAAEALDAAHRRGAAAATKTGTAWPETPKA